MFCESKKKGKKRRSAFGLDATRRENDLGEKTSRKMFPHLLCNRTQTNRREVVDGEPRVLGVVEREHVLERSLHAGLSEPLRQLLHSQLLRHLLEQDLDEDTTRRGGFVLVHVDDVEDSPRDSVRRDEVTEEATDVSKSVGLVSMDGVVVVGEGLFEGVAPDSIDLAESFSDETVEGGVRPFLGATLDDHVTELDLEGMKDKSEVSIGGIKSESRESPGRGEGRDGGGRWIGTRRNENVPRFPPRSGPS